MNESDGDKPSWPKFFVMAIIFLVVAWFALPRFDKRPTRSYVNKCINNLRQIDDAIQQWRLEQGKKPEDNVEWNDITSYFKDKIACPKGGKYTIGPTVTNTPTCTIPRHVLPQ